MPKSTNIKVVGVGGAGCNAVTRMFDAKIQGVELVAVNTDAQDLEKTRAHHLVRIGRNLTRGLGTGMNPESGRLAAEENRNEIAQLLKGSSMVFIAAGLGGGTGSGAAPVVADIARKEGALTVAIVAKPFSFEGAQRRQIATKALQTLKDKVDALIAVSNDKILSLVDAETTLQDALLTCDEILHQAVQGITDIILIPGIINVDFADVKAIMQGAGKAMFGIGRAQGERRIVEAARLAMRSPLLDFSIEGAKGLLFNIMGRGDLSLAEIEEAAKIITQSMNPEAKVIFGATRDRSLEKNEVKIILIATGFSS